MHSDLTGWLADWADSKVQHSLGTSENECERARERTREERWREIFTAVPPLHRWLKLSLFLIRVRNETILKGMTLTLMMMMNWRQLQRQRRRWWWRVTLGGESQPRCSLTAALMSFKSSRFHSLTSLPPSPLLSLASKLICALEVEQIRTSISNLTYLEPLILACTRHDSFTSASCGTPNPQSSSSSSSSS